MGTSFGKEVILDLYECDIRKFNREDIEKYLKLLCDLIDMEREALHYWDYEDTDMTQADIDALPDHLVGTSAVQFIKTSNVTIHTLDRLGAVLLNIFSCKDFDEHTAIGFSEWFFKGKIENSLTIIRGENLMKGD